jgi:hypothetical protein
MTTLEAEQAIRALASARQLQDPYLKRWLAREQAERVAILEAARKLRLRTGQLAVALDLLEEIAVREGAGIDSILSRESLQRLIQSEGPAPARASAFLAELRAIRFPRLGATIRRLDKEISALALPSAVNVVLPKDLNSDELVIRISVRSADELDWLMNVLAEKREGLARLVRMLGGDDDL